MIERFPFPLLLLLSRRRVAGADCGHGGDAGS
jgi:hypothetical protein